MTAFIAIGRVQTATRALLAATSTEITSCCCCQQVVCILPSFHNPAHHITSTTGSTLYTTAPHSLAAPHHQHTPASAHAHTQGRAFCHHSTISALHCGMTDTQNQGWSQIGARLLSEYGSTTTAPQHVPTVRYAKTWAELKALPIMRELLELAVQHMALLHAVDTLPRGTRVLVCAGVHCMRTSRHLLPTCHPRNPTTSTTSNNYLHLPQTHRRHVPG